MRFLSFLPMLLLLFSGSLGAQNQCSIYDLTATVVNFDPASCQYFVVLDFEHSGTTNQFTVKGNGVNYGTFNYDSVPVKIGPFTAGPAPTSKEFVVTDAVYLDCQDDVVVQVPTCAQNTACDIYDLTVTTGDCNPGSLTYELTLNFKVNNPNNDFFEVWAGNGIYLGIYPLNQLPLKIPAFPWSGDPTDQIKVCINDNPNCCETLTFDAPDCNQTPCIITNLTVNRGECTSDSTYKVEVNFLLNNTTISEKFGLWANDSLLGIFGTDQLPLTIDSFPWNGDTTDMVKVCVFDVVTDPSLPPQILCCKTLEFLVPDCLPIYPCGIKNLTVETDSCSSDSTFGIWVNFTVNDTSAVDSFQLWGNGHDLGTYSLDSLPLYIADFPWNHGIFSYIRVCTGNAPTCCKEYQFLAPDCLPFGPCEVTDIFIQTGGCTSDSTYKVKLNFQATNPGNGTFIAWANGALIDTFPLTAAPLALDSFPWSGNNVDVVKICIGGTNDTLPCCREEEYHVPDCLTGDTCAITNVVVDPGDCNPGNDSYSLYLNFEVTNPGNDHFELWTGSGVYLGNFPLSELPLTIPDFPCNNAGVGVLKICINDNPDCCTIVDFQAPSCCGGGGPCEITDLAVQTGDCNGNDSYEVWLNFNVTNPLSDNFGVWANGEYLGSFPLDSLPLYIPDFPWNGGNNDVVKVCFISPNGAIGCCKIEEFEVPDCLDQLCEIYNLTVETGDCNNDSTYHVWINFNVANPPGDTFGVWANGQFFGAYSLNDLPLQINNFPWDGGSNDVVKVCFINTNDPAGSATCCRTKEFQVPGCLKCEIYDLTVETGDCTGNDTYEVWIDFQVANQPADSFQLWANGDFYGMFHADSLPLYIADFPWNGGDHDVVKVCFATNGVVGCCNTKEFSVPDCLDDDQCEIYNLTVETGDCTSDDTYEVWINFDVNNPPGDQFGVWANGDFLGNFNLNDLPLQISDFPWDGGSNDVVKVCFTNQGAVSCCKIKEFAVPDCLDQGDPCHISDLNIDTGDCTGDSTYTVTINFDVINPPADSFDLFANFEYFGTYSLSDLPLTIQDFPWDGGPVDHVRVCISDDNAPPGQPFCCKLQPFQVPDCLDQGGGDCDISNLTVETGDCTSDDTYQVWINFEVNNPPTDEFGVWANGDFLGFFSVDSLPLYIADFPWNGGDHDVVKVCFNDNNNPSCPVLCCATEEFEVPDCLDQGGDCEIHNLTVETGDCTSDDTYEVWINFDVDNAPGDQFGVWANGDFLGLFDLDSLPLYIADFHWNGGANDVVKICFPAPNGAVTCCKTKEFAVPDCIDQDPCHIYDLHVVKTPCLCGQFFVLVSFEHNNGGDEGFDIVGNGNDYGNFPYNYPQPVILGPFNGDGTTDYEFAVQDHQHPDCADDAHLGTVDCMTPVVTPGSDATLTLSPNPTSNWLNVTAQLQSGAQFGEANVEIYHADGRLMRNVTVTNGSNFLLDVSDLPAGVYRLSLKAAAGRVEGTFAKQ